MPLPSPVDDRNPQGHNVHGVHREGQVWSDPGRENQGSRSEGDVSVP